jgi:tRNA (adenine22-N1)-methyltransferase
MKLPPLDARLRLIVSMVRPGRPAADVGTDHGKLIAHLVGTGRSTGGCATDIRPGPLSKARELVDELGLQDKIQVLLCDGLAAVKDHMAQEIIIAGMGGDTIVHILESWPWSKEPDKHFLLQAMTKPEVLRSWLWQNGFDIAEERCAFQSGHAYSVMSVYYTGQTKEPDELMLCLGAIRDFDHPDAQAYGQKILFQLEQKAAGMEKAGQDAAHWRGLMEQIKARMTTKEAQP